MSTYIRRKFVDGFTAQGSAIAEEAIKRIARLYGVEKEVRGQSPEPRVALRQANAKPAFNDLEEWLHAQLPKNLQQITIGSSHPLCPEPPAQETPLTRQRLSGTYR